MELEFSRKDVTKTNIKFNENPSSGSRVVPGGRADGLKDGQTDMTRLIVAFSQILRTCPKNSEETEI